MTSRADVGGLPGPPVRAAMAPATVRRSVTLIVLEAGSSWPGHVVGQRDVVAMSAQSGDLLGATHAKLDALASAERHIRIAVLACSLRASAERRAVAHALMTSVVLGAAGRLVLSADDKAGATLRAELLALAGALGAAFPSTDAVVSLKFVADPPRWPARR